MGICHDVEQSLEKYDITKIDGQPMDEDLNLLTKELTNAASRVTTQNGGGEHGHVGVIINETEYITFSKSGERKTLTPFPTVVIGPSAKATLVDHWAQHLKHWKEFRDIKQLEVDTIKQAIMQAMLDSSASKTFVNTHQGLQLTGPTNTTVITAGGTKLCTSNTVHLLTHALSKGAREALVIPGMSQPALMSVLMLANNGYTTVFLPGQKGVDIFHANDIAISSTALPALQGWQDGRGLWMVPIVDKPTISPIDVSELDWDYKNRKVHLSMAPYLQKALRQFNNIVPKKCEDSPYPYSEPKYGAKQQFADYDQVHLLVKTSKNMFSRSWANSIGTCGGWAAHF